jgi:hypothetical protein
MDLADNGEQAKDVHPRRFETAKRGVCAKFACFVGSVSILWQSQVLLRPLLAIAPVIFSIPNSNRSASRALAFYTPHHFLSLRWDQKPEAFSRSLIVFIPRLPRRLNF